MSMSPVHLSRAQRRKMQKLADKVDRITDSDRRFFNRFPQRQYRVRPAGQAEIEELKIAGERIHEGATVCIAVRNVEPGLRLRAFVQMFIIGSLDTDLGEDESRAIFERVAPPEMCA